MQFVNTATRRLLYPIKCCLWIYKILVSKLLCNIRTIGKCELKKKIGAYSKDIWQKGVNPQQGDQPVSGTPEHQLLLGGSPSTWHFYRKILGWGSPSVSGWYLGQWSVGHRTSFQNSSFVRYFLVTNEK